MDKKRAREFDGLFIWVYRIYHHPRRQEIVLIGSIFYFLFFWMYYVYMYYVAVYSIKSEYPRQLENGFSDKGSFLLE